MISSGSAARVLNVCNDCSYRTVKSAVEAAASGDSIIVGAGRFTCRSLEITKPLTLLAKPGAILDGEQSGYVLKLLADNIMVSGFSIMNSGISYTKDFAAIYTFKTSGIHIHNNEISNSFFGILLEKSSGGSVIGMLIKASTSIISE